MKSIVLRPFPLLSMQNYLDKRPLLPATSRATSAGGSNKSSKKNASSSVVDSNKYSPESIIQRLIQPLSVDSQNTVLSMVQCLVENQRTAILRNEHMKTEMIILRNDCDKAKADNSLSAHQIANLKVKVTEANKKNEALIDLVQNRDEQHTHAQLLFERLRRDNTLLKESVESINLSAPRVNSALKSRPSSSISPSRSRDHLQQALRDADLSMSIMEDSETSEAETQFVSSTMASLEASAGIVTNEPKGQRRPVTAPVSLPSIAGSNNDNNCGSLSMKTPEKVRFDSSIDKPRPQTAGPTMKASASALSPAPRGSYSPSRSIASMSSEKSDKSEVSAHTFVSVLDKPPERINGTYRNQPESFLLDKLRKALLRMTRDKYRAEKREKILTIHMENIKAELRDATLKMRHMQIELAGMP